MAVKTEVMPGANNVAPVSEQASFGAISPELQIEIDQLTFRLHALNNFAVECRAEGGKTSAQNQIYRHEERLKEPSQESIGLLQSRELLRKSEITASNARVFAKADFANSIGIRAHADVEKNEDDDIISAELRLDDASRSAELSTKYQRFRDAYAETTHRKNRDRRRAELQYEIASKKAEALGEDVPAIVTELNENKGVIDIDDLQSLQIDPEQPTDITEFSRAIGTALSKKPRNGSGIDRPLWVYLSDFHRAKPATIESGLYIPPDDAKYKIVARLAIIGETSPDLKLKGVVPRLTGVVVGENEYKRFAHSASGLIRHTEARTLDANSLISMEEKNQKAGRAMAHVMETKLGELGKFDEELLDLHSILARIYENARKVGQPVELTKNLNRDRKIADEIVHEIVEIASYSLNHGTTITNALHRAITSDLYRRGSSRQLAESRQRYTALAGRYVNAKRGKINQSQKACQRQLASHAHFLAPAEL